MYSEQCVFCRDVIRDRKASIIYENNNVLAFMDIAPVEPGHVLVVPREHYVNILDIDEWSYLEVHRVAKQLSPAIIRAVGGEAVNIGQNNGACANQRVFHYHLHIIPRFCDRRLDWSRRIVRENELDEVAEKIRAEIQNRDGAIPELK
ncbi:MAG: HIT family protein [Candidatus Thermoplasmatota archaeon]|jgi:bis(5'-nucleosidyl)-tetraphosphatase/histidine triad (HIT) family protein|nr:HIT family protein [Candidatus Thermoplasmatota archaeon]